MYETCVFEAYLSEAEGQMSTFTMGASDLGQFNKVMDMAEAEERGAEVFQWC